MVTERRIVQPIWGGTRLAAWLELPEPRPERIGETWQVYDTNAILNGPLAGRTLAQVTQQYAAELVGTRTVERYGRDFPLLAKFIDAAAPLSIQVHPDDAYAHEHEAATGFHGKTEAWYIIEATPGASVVYGLDHSSSRDELKAAVEDGSIEALFRRVPVQAGDVVFVPAGTMHAIDAGIMLFEIQQKSDLTYRLYDYGRRDAQTGQPRELHVQKALDVTDFAPPARTTIPPLGLGESRQLLIACDSFALEGWTIEKVQALSTDPSTFEIITVIEGALQLHANGDVLKVRRGDSVVLPASLGGYQLQPEPQTVGGRLLRAYVPDLEHDIVAPLKARGMDPALIAGSVVL